MSVTPPPPSPTSFIVANGLVGDGEFAPFMAPISSVVTTEEAISRTRLSRLSQPLRPLEALSQYPVLINVGISFCFKLLFIDMLSCISFSAHRAS